MPCLLMYETDALATAYACCCICLLPTLYAYAHAYHVVIGLLCSKPVHLLPHMRAAPHACCPTCLLLRSPHGIRVALPRSAPAPHGPSPHACPAPAQQQQQQWQQQQQQQQVMSLRGGKAHRSHDSAPAGHLRALLLLQLPTERGGHHYLQPLQLLDSQVTAEPPPTHAQPHVAGVAYLHILAGTAAASGSCQQPHPPITILCCPDLCNDVTMLCCPDLCYDVMDITMSRITQHAPGTCTLSPSTAAALVLAQPSNHISSKQVR
jgi:hypothetical protein